MRNTFQIGVVLGALITLWVACEQSGCAQYNLKKAQTIDSFIRRTRAPTSLQDVVARQANVAVTSGAIDPSLLRAAPANVGRSRGMATRSLGTGTSSSANKPFSYVAETPAVSPYQNLYREDLGDAAPNYYSLVRPQLQQNSFQRQQQLRNQQVSRQMQDLQSRPAYAAQGSQQMFPTGHSTIFRYYSHFYPGMSRRR